MKRDSLEEQLARVHQRVTESSGHERVLRAELVARFRQQFSYPPSVRHTERSFTMQKAVFALIVVIGLVAASRAPAEYAVEVGKRIDIAVAQQGADWPQPAEFDRVLQHIGPMSEVQLRARKTPDAFTLTIELWGTSIADDAAEQLRSALPALRDARISVVPLETRLHGTLAGKIGSELFKHQDPAAFEAAKAQLQAQLQAELQASGQQGTVKVEADQVDGRERVMIKVEKKGEAGAETEDLVGPAGEAPAK